MEAANDEIVRATRDEIVAYGIRRATMGSIARRAGISRATLYRRAGTMDELVRDALVSQLSTLVITMDGDPSTPITRNMLVENVVRGIETLWDDELLGAILLHEPELLLPYLTERIGRSQRILLEGLSAVIAHAQGNHEVRQGDPRVLALGLLQSLTGFVVGQKLLIASASRDVWRRECAHLINGYLAPATTSTPMETP